jgi:hypothetical protein
VGKPEVKRSLGKFRPKWEEEAERHGMKVVDWNHLGQDRDSCARRKRLSVSIKFE